MYEATGDASARGAECDATVTFEMPPSGEPPEQLDARVVHEVILASSQSARHTVELLLSGPGGRPLHSSRTFARTPVDVA